VSLALYRRYRPETFDEVIGQDHVTEPLRQALRNDRVHHAYLFSGPRGCGKTTSSRILARALNCERGPTPTPCGKCQSCQDLTRGGSGSIDVIEIDAASHGGVDDARDLRERAFFAPAASRYKIYIVDEAHMVTSAGFNALLKVVEEPPAHLKFIFATTEPDKVIGTIRSRTHHYPFRLVPPGVLRDYLATVCAQEGVAVENGVLPLVVRAGAGSVRDAMSVLDQLIAGSGPQGVTYALATSLLGYTDATLLDDMTEALAASDGAVAFDIVDRVIEGGHDPRRFLAELLERFRDLVILKAVPDAAVKGLIDRPSDQLERMQNQAASYSAAELSRAAEEANAGLTQMRGTTTPRLQLELTCARILLPGAEDGERGLAARLDRLERNLAISVAPGEQANGSRSEHTLAPEQTPVEKDDAMSSDSSSSAPPAVPASPASAGSTFDVVAIRRRWPEVLDTLKEIRRFAWMLLSQNAQVAAVERTMLSIAFLNPGARDSFVSSRSEENLRQALTKVFGVDWRIECLLDPSQASHQASGATPEPSMAPTRNSSESPPEPPATPSVTSPHAAASAPAAARAASLQVETDAAEDDANQPHLIGPELVMREFGAKVISEIDHE